MPSFLIRPFREQSVLMKDEQMMSRRDGWLYVAAWFMAVVGPVIMVASVMLGLWAAGDR